MKIHTDRTGLEPTRSEQTKHDYRRRGERLFKAAGVDVTDLIGLVDWFVTQHFRWAPSTVVQYRASLRQVTEDSALNPDLAGHLDQRLAEGPVPRTSGPPRTSARKRKSLPREEWVRLVKHLEHPNGHPDDRLAARLLRHNVLLFMRRVEWETAEVVEEHLVIQNAKATNGRSIGPERRRDLSDYGKPGVRSLRELIITLRDRSKDEGGFVALWARLSSRIARACKKLHMKRVSIYTTRHVGMANAKSWMKPEEVAASAGHKTTATASSHYAKRRSGWGSKAQRVARPASEDVQKVIKSPKWSRQANIEYYQERAQRLQESQGPTF